MFSLNGSLEKDRPILKCAYLYYTPPCFAYIDEIISHFFNDVAKGDSLKTRKFSYSKLDIVVRDHATCNRYADVQEIRWVNLAPIILFSVY